jgi:riboflavin synthase
MFTGLIEDIGVVAAVQRKAEGMTVTLSTSIPTSEIKLGDSIACDGACLTVVGIGERQFTVELSYETVQRTTWKDVKNGHRANLERALRMGDRLGGHIVSGHVDGMGRLARLEKKGKATDIHIQCDSDITRLIVDKGSIAIDGISLTVNRVDTGSFMVTLIPHTQSETTLIDKRVGESVNLETDVLGKYIDKLIHPGGRLDRDYLAKHGFLK